MKRFIIKSALFALANGVVALAVLMIADSRLHFQQYETNSILLSTPRNTDIDLIILGTSHSRLFTRIKCNWEMLERELGMNVLNLSIPFGGGIVPEKLFLANFFREGNRAKTILYFLDPFTLYSVQVNTIHKFVYYEPLRLSFLVDLIRNHIPPERIFIYIQSKFSLRWFLQTPGIVACDHEANKTNFLTPEIIQKHFDSYYTEGYDDALFRKYAPVLDEIFDMASRNGCRLVIAFPPTLLGREPGAPALMKKLDELHARYPFEFYDFTDVLHDYSLYSDSNHLNSEGLEVFVRQFLKPALINNGGA